MSAAIRWNSRILDDAATVRVRAFIGAVGSIKRAAARLHVSEQTMDAARGYGRLTASASARLLEALAREESALSEAS